MSELENNEQAAAQTNAAPQLVVNQEKLANYLQSLQMEQRLMPAILSGFAVSVLCAVLWAAITVATEYQIGYMALAVGFAVGFAVRFVGKGMDKVFGIVGGFFALLGCLLGNLFTIIGFGAQYAEVGYFESIPMIDWAAIPGIMMETFSPIDLLFYGIAVYEGYRFAFRQVTEEELMAHAMEEQLPEEQLA